MGKNQTHIMRKFVIFSVALFLFILVAGTAVFIFSMRSIIQDNKGGEMSQMLEIQRITLENNINSEIAIVLKLADSSLIKRYFMDPSDTEIEQYALEEIAGYRRAFSSGSIFWINDKDKIFYSDDNDPYVVNPALPDQYWYNMTMYETEVYNFNINYNSDLNISRLWINAPVFDENGKPLGMVGTGIELTEYIEMLYRGFEESVGLYLFNASGEMTGSKNVEDVVNKKKIDSEAGLFDLDFSIIDEAKSLKSGEMKTFDSPGGKIVMGTIPVLGWYTIAVSPIVREDFDTTMAALFVVMIAVIAIILIIFNLFIAGFLKSLKKSMESLKAASKAKSEFLATMSHEIRTPLNSIIGVAQIQLQNSKLPKDFAGEMEKIYSSGNNLLGIINDILDMSKIETGKLELNPTEYSVPDLINDAVQLNIVRIGSKPIQFFLETDEMLPLSLHGDVLRIKQILNNLLSNAIKYTENGFVKLSVSHGMQGDKTALRFIVEDSGQGMKPEDLKKLFLEYSRLNVESNRSVEGTGLGLSITKRLVEMMGGTIDVRSEYGKGSAFIVTVKQIPLPCNPIGKDIAEKLCSFSYKGGKQLTDLQITRTPMPYGHVLVVDDTRTNLYVAKGLLAAYELNVETAESGHEAIEKIQNGGSYDLIFMDHMMPGMDGIETVRKLREDGYTGSVVVLTANALAGNERMFEENGFDGFISKPIDVKRLDEILNKFIRGKENRENEAPD